MTRELRVAPSLLTAEERLYLAAPADLLQVLRELGGASRQLMVVGHNPGITEFANRLSADDTIDNMPTCAVFTARFEITSWDRLDWGCGQDAEFDYPRKAT
jgi:phosphohistidine phosphatase